MKEELIYAVDKIEHIKCRIHNQAAEIEIVQDNIQVKCCCEKHKQFLERQIEYEIYRLFEEDENKTEVISCLKYAV